MVGLFILAIFCVIMGAYSIKSGTLIMRGRYEREFRPVTYWFGTITYFIMAIAAVVAAGLKYAQ